MQAGAYRGESRGALRPPLLLELLILRAGRIGKSTPPESLEILFFSVLEFRTIFQKFSKKCSKFLKISKNLLKIFQKRRKNHRVPLIFLASRHPSLRPPVLDASVRSWMQVDIFNKIFHKKRKM